MDGRTKCAQREDADEDEDDEDEDDEDESHVTYHSTENSILYTYSVGI